MNNLNLFRTKTDFDWSMVKLSISIFIAPHNGGGNNNYYLVQRK